MNRAIRLAALIATPAILVLALWAMHHSLGKYHLSDVVAAVSAVQRWQILSAIVLTILSYLVLTNYDRLAARASNVRLSHARLSLVSFIAQSCSFTLGHPAVVGTSVRYRFYTDWGVAPEIVLQIGIYSGVSFWLGILAVAGVVLLAGGHTLPEPTWHGVPWPVLGTILLALVAGFMWACIARRRPLKLWKWELPLPSPRFGLGMILIGSIDWLITAAVFYVLLPPGSVGFGYLLTVFMLAQAGGILSHVPAGAGVFEAVTLKLLENSVGQDRVMGALVMFRVIYYLGPFIAAVALLVGSEVWRRRHWLSRVFAASDRAVDSLVPTMMATVVFLCGMMLLVSSFTPALHQRLEAADGILPLPALELAHASSAMVGAALLVLARGLHHRLHAAYTLVLPLIAIGVVSCLGKGLDYEEAAVLAGVGILLLPTSRLFHRTLGVSETLSAKWLQLNAIALILCIGIGLFAYNHISYQGELWSTFRVGLEPARSLRAASGAVAVLALFTSAWFLRTPTLSASLPTTNAIDRAAAIAADSPRAEAHLALVGDKRLLFHPTSPALVMYGVRGNTWVAMGDPIGDEHAARELVWRFRELCETRGARSVFFLAGAGSLDIYVDAELRLMPIGEEARVDLAADGDHARADAIAERDRAAAAGVSVEILPREAVPAALDELHAVSNAWLAVHGPEKGFASGRFSRDYLQRAPVAVARKGGRIIAFANLWPSGCHEELGIDLIRQLPDAPPGSIDAVMLELIGWGKAKGFRWLDLGTAPLPGADPAHELAPLWRRVGTAAFAHGELFADAADLRRFKQRFAPVWRKRYLAYPDMLGLPLACDDIAALISAVPPHA